MPKSTVTNISKRIDTSRSKLDGTINYDIDNAYPQRVIDILNSSGTGTLCSEMLQKYINGQGFVSDKLAKTQINSNGLTANKLLFKVAKSLSDHNGFIIHVNYNMNYRERNYSLIPFSHGRLPEEDAEENPNMLRVYDDWDNTIRKKIDEDKIDYINFYDPNPDVIAEEVKAAGGWENYKGQALYWTPLGKEYILAPSDPVLEDIQTDSSAKIFKNRNITTNFMASHIIETTEFESEDERQEFIDNLVEFQGSDDALKLFLLEKKAGQEGPGFTLEKIDIQDVEKLYEFTEGSVRDNIIRRYQIPPVLLFAIPGKLGSSSEMKEASALYNGNTEIYRRSVSEVFDKLLSNSVYIVGDDFDIEPFEVNVVESKETSEGKKEVVNLLSNNSLSESQKKVILQVVYSYTADEAMKLIPTVVSAEGGGEAVDEEAKARAALKGSVGGVTGILAIQTAVAQGTIEPDAGAAVLELIFGMGPKEAERMLKGKDIMIS